MNPKDTMAPDQPDIPINPEDSPRLQAIEALEAREVDPNPRPFSVDDLKLKPRPVTPVVKAPVEPPKPVPAIVATPKPVVPVIAAPTPAALPAPEPTPVPIATPPAPIVAPVVQEKPKPAAPKTPAAEMAEELANAPPTKLYQFFHDQNGLRKPPIIIIAIAAVVIIGIIAFLILKSM